LPQSSTEPQSWHTAPFAPHWFTSVPSTQAPAFRHWFAGQQVLPAPAQVP
jgi:hypothetical protein